MALVLDPETGIETGGQSAAYDYSPVLEVNSAWCDPEGEIAVTRSYWAAAAGSAVPLAQATVTAIQAAINQIGTALQAMSAAQLKTITGGVRAYVGLEKPSEPAAGTAADDSEDKAYIEYRTALNKKVALQVPMPLVANFKTDGETLDPASTTVNAYSTLAIGGATVAVPAVAGGNLLLVQTDSLGNPIQTYNKGYARRTKMRRKLRAGISTEIGG